MSETSKTIEALKVFFNVKSIILLVNSESIREASMIVILSIEIMDFSKVIPKLDRSKAISEKDSKLMSLSVRKSENIKISGVM